MMGVRSGLRATISPSLGSTCLMIWSSHRAILAVSLVTGRVSVMFDQVTRPGSCQSKPLLPPSAYVSTSTWAPSPEQVRKAPRSLPPMVSLKNGVVAKMSSVVM